MSEQEFLDKVKELKIDIFYRLEEKKYWECRYQHRKPTQITLDDYLYSSWTCGGVSGGSCWGSDSLHPRTPDPEPEFESLDTLLTELCPKITFLQYKKIAKLEQQDSYTIDEYYGNSTEIAFKTIKLRDVYEQLKEMKLL
jgi:hypothetical protein